MAETRSLHNLLEFSVTFDKFHKSKCETFGLEHLEVDMVNWVLTHPTIMLSITKEDMTLRILNKK